MDNKELSPEAKLAVQSIKMALSSMILNIPDDAMWLMIKAVSSAQAVTEKEGRE